MVRVRGLARGALGVALSTGGVGAASPTLTLHPTRPASGIVLRPVRTRRQQSLLIDREPYIRGVRVWTARVWTIRITVHGLRSTPYHYMPVYGIHAPPPPSDPTPRAG